jgi:hypothetical protein
MKRLHIEFPAARCGYCGFTSGVYGEWTVEDGRLVFRAEADPLPGRGPDLFGCCEGSECGDFSGVEFDYGQDPLSDAEFAALRRAASP